MKTIPNRLHGALRSRLSALVMIMAALVIYPCYSYAGVSEEAIEKGDKAVADGDYASAVEFFSQVLAEVKAGDAESDCSRALEYGGNACVCLNRYVEALDFYTHAIAVAEKYGNRRILANCMSNVGLVYAVFNDYERAAWYFTKAYDCAMESDDNYLLAISTTNLVKAYCYLGDADKALEYMAHQAAHPIDDKRMQQYYTLFNQGLVSATGKNYTAGIYYLEKACELAEAHDLPQSIKSDVNCELGRIYAVSGKTDSALMNYMKVVEYDHNPQREQQALLAMARIHRERGDSVAAVRCESEYMLLSDSIFDRQQFNSARGRLLHYENMQTERKIGKLKGWISTLAWVMALTVAVLVVVVYYNRKLKITHKLIIDKNRDLSRQNEELRQLRSIRSEKAAFGKGADCAVDVPDIAASESVDSTAQDISKMESTLGEERVRMMLEKIEEVFSDNKMIFNPDFDLDTLSKAIGTNTRYVSMVINGAYGVNFKTLLNKYRISEACRRLTDKAGYGHLTIAAIGEEVGYSTVNNFIIAFKKINGMTPSQYQKLAERQ